MSTWVEFRVDANLETAEPIVELFNRYGRGQAVVETPVDCFEYELHDCVPGTVIVKTYLPLEAREARRRLEEGLWHLGRILPIPEPEIRELAEEDWAQAWKEQYHRMRVGRRIVIVPAWEEYGPAPGEVVLRLEPGMAFGTGLHPTTRLCLTAIEDELAPAQSVLDVGTGSGVLAIAAARLGAEHVLAIDADPVAVRVAGENVAANGVAEQVEVRRASLAGGDAVPRHFMEVEDGAVAALPILDSGCFDLVLVNILAPVITGMAAALAARTAPGGHLIAAGLIETQEAGVLGALQVHGLALTRRTQEQDWVCLTLARLAG
ncbi:MAG: 50S ribosomal protein L11 methyltransferase [Anaerolineae bacterium]|nr:50S ribosomal protein L11 methyltransferase [Anaerolineae bacterium]